MNRVITNREFLRRFKDLKRELISGSVQRIIVPQKGGVNLSISVEHAETPFSSLVFKVRRKPLNNIIRPSEDLF